MDKFKEQFNKVSAQHREELAKLQQPQKKTNDSDPSAIFLQRKKVPTSNLPSDRDKLLSAVGSVV